MEIRMKAPGSFNLPSGAVQTCPENWTGEVPEETAAYFVNQGLAEIIADPGTALFTPEQAAVLAAAADQALAIVAEAIDAQPPAAQDFEGATLAEIRAVAIARNVPGATKLSRKDLIALLTS